MTVHFPPHTWASSTPPIRPRRPPRDFDMLVEAVDRHIASKHCGAFGSTRSVYRPEERREVAEDLASFMATVLADVGVFWFLP